MGKTLTLEGPPLEWARSQFAAYYATAAIDPPVRLARREFAAFPFTTETMMRRHATLRTPTEFREFLREETPRHVYYSSAYYQRPAAPTMAAKGWQGADLIFDLDADHLRGADGMDYAGQLALVKSRLIMLAEEFLFPDFGVDPAQTMFVFSGGRGYHVHVRDPRFLSLTSPERRELVDYILASGVDVTKAVTRRRADVRAGRTIDSVDSAEGGDRYGRAPAIRELVADDTPGWSGHLARALPTLLRRWLDAGPKVAAREMVRFGVPPSDAPRFARILVTKKGAERIIEKRSLDAIKDPIPDEFWQFLARAASIEVQGETDAPVTTDIHRLIRLPDSLHGGTGFRVVPLAWGQIQEFDPFRDAVVAAPDGERTAVTYLEEARYPFPGGGIHLESGRTDELPTPVALFLVLRGQAELRPSPG